jgi:DNA-binding transcriptional MerR regulator
MAEMTDRMSIDELADAAGLTRRAVRYYVQQKLLPAPLGVGRGKHYDATHLARIRRLRELQAAGYALDAIRTILEGGEAPEPPPTARPKPRPAGQVQLWNRVKISEGLELHLDMKRFNVDIAQLAMARELLRAAFGLNDSPTEDATDNEKPA